MTASADWQSAFVPTNLLTLGYNAWCGLLSGERGAVVCSPWQIRAQSSMKPGGALIVRTQSSLLGKKRLKLCPTRNAPRQRDKANPQNARKRALQTIPPGS
jgi:hypothetical protein